MEGQGKGDPAGQAVLNRVLRAGLREKARLVQSGAEIWGNSLLGRHVVHSLPNGNFTFNISRNCQTALHSSCPMLPSYQQC